MENSIPDKASNSNNLVGAATAAVGDVVIQALLILEWTGKTCGNRNNWMPWGFFLVDHSGWGTRSWWLSNFLDVVRAIVGWRTCFGFLLQKEEQFLEAFSMTTP